MACEMTDDRLGVCECRGDDVEDSGRAEEVVMGMKERWVK